MKQEQTLKNGMIGESPGAFIGAIHRKVERMDICLETVADMLSHIPEKSRKTGQQLSFATERGYGNYK